MKYWVFKTPIQIDGAHLSTLPPFGPEDFMYDKGVTLLEQHPKNEESIMCFDPNFPENIKLYDFVSNLDDVIIGSEKAQKVLLELEIDNIEFLPIWITDHQDSVASKEYAIINPVGSIEAIDMVNSEVRMSRLIKDQISRIRNLKLNYDAIPDDIKMFRASTKLDEIFIRDDVKLAFESAGLNGWKVYEPEGWNGLDL